MKNYAIKLTLLEECLGTVPKDKEIYESYVQSKAPHAADDELETVEEISEKGWTGFHMLDGNPIFYNYVIKGFFKDACGMLKRAEKDDKLNKYSKDLKAHLKVIDGLVFVYPRRIAINTNGNSLGILERPLRAKTPQGERVALARSDTVPAGSTLEFTVEILGVVKEAMLKEWLDYGKRRGLGQWRNACYGSFSYELSKA